MATTQEKTLTPAIISYGALINFLDKLREHGDVPTRIDRTLMPSASGSQVFALLGALKFLQLIDDSGRPNEAFRRLVLASDEERKPMISELMRERYDFLFNDPHFHLDKATSGLMAEKFRDLDISGSTVTKAVSFFLAAAKEGGIKVSPHVKPPPAPIRAGTPGKKSSKKKEEPMIAANGSEEDESDATDVERFEIPVPGKSSVKVIVPNDLDADDWEMLQSMITVYIRRWKGFKEKSAKADE